MFNYHEAEIFPRIVNINVLKGACPCRCVHCPVGKTKPSEREKVFGKAEMDIELFQRIALEIAEYQNCAVRIHSVGEPLLWTHLPEAAGFLGEKNIQSWIFISAVTQDKKLLKTLCDNISIIEISVNAIHPDEYLATKGVDAFATVISNIQWMSGYIKTNQLKTKLLLSRVETSYKEADKTFVDYWTQTGLAADVFVRSYHNYNNLLSVRNGNSPKESCLTQLQGRNKRFRLRWRDDNVPKEPCLALWARASIDCDGTMVCCFNELFKRYSPDVILGKLGTGVSIRHLWQSEKLHLIRACDTTGDFSSLNFQVPCKNCTSCLSMKNTENASEKQLTS